MTDRPHMRNEDGPPADWRDRYDLIAIFQEVGLGCGMDLEALVDRIILPEARR